MSISPRPFVLAKKEIYSWLHSPAVYGVTVFFLLFVSVWFYYLQGFFAMDTATLRPFFTAFPLAFIFVIPVLTMKAWAEEKKLGSVEILFTMPFTEWELVLGKFLSCFAIIVGMIFLTLPVPLSLLPLGYFEAGVILAEYSGALLLGAAACSLGLFLSSISKNQAASFVGSAVVLIVFTSGLTMLFALMAEGFSPALSRLVNFLSLSFHFESFSRGLLDSRDLAFFLITTVLFLFLNAQVLTFRRWK
jgi:ABC-2 type transport system permease protein